jgi:hypothetical protein
MNIAAEPVELRHDDRRNPVVVVFDALCGLERRLQLWPSLKRVALGALNLNEAGDDVEALGFAEAPDRLTLRFEPEP